MLAWWVRSDCPFARFAGGRTVSQVLRKIRVLVADDENMFRHALASLLTLTLEITLAPER